MPVVVYVDTPKGGTGKTTTSMCLAPSLAAYGRVLLASLSRQNEVSALIPGRPAVPAGGGLRAVIAGTSDHAPQPAAGGKFDVLPAGSTPIPDDIDRAAAARRVIRFLRAGEYDWVVVDGAQMADAGCLAVAQACDLLLVPVSCDRFAAQAASAVVRWAAGLPAAARPRVKVLFTKAWAPSFRSRSEQRLYDRLRDEWDATAFRTMIRYSRDKQADDWSAHTSQQVDSMVVNPSGIIAEDHAHLAAEIAAMTFEKGPQPT